MFFNVGANKGTNITNVSGTENTQSHQPTNKNEIKI